MMRASSRLVSLSQLASGVAVCACVCAVACGGAEGSGGSGSGGAGSAGLVGSGAGSTSTSGSGTGSSGNNGAGGDGGGFNPTAGVGGGNACAGALPATIRDFSAGHPDFQSFTGNAATTGLVEELIGDDNTPVYAHEGGSSQITGPDTFAQWYHDVPDVNHAFTVSLPLTQESSGSYVFADNSFFPIDDMGFGNEGNDNNFHFTTEVHVEFSYEGGETFTFIGDDDLWLFINGRLAIDLGGAHPELSATIDLDDLADSLEIAPGNSYPMDIFHAERHTSESNFRIETSIGCFIEPPQ